MTIKETQTGYLTNPSFKNLYLFLAWNKLSSKAMIMQVEAQAERYLLLE